MSNTSGLACRQCGLHRGTIWTAFSLIAILRTLQGSCAVAQVAVSNETELVELTQQGLARRTVASTSMNAASSRSHCLITLTVQRHLPDGSVMHGKLTLVDLAGRTGRYHSCLKDCNFL